MNDRHRTVRRVQRKYERAKRQQMLNDFAFIGAVLAENLCAVVEPIIEATSQFYTGVAGILSGLEVAEHDEG